MHVLMLSWEYPPHVVGGLGRHVMDLLPALDTTDPTLDVTLLVPNLDGGAPNEALTPRVRVVRVAPPQAAASDFLSFVAQTNLALEQAAQELRAQGQHFDLLHNHDWMTARSAIGLKQRWGLPLVTTIHATERGRGRGHLPTDHAVAIDRIEQWITSQSQRLIVCSHYMAGQIIADFRLNRERIEVVPNAVYIESSPFSNEEARLAYRRRFVTDDEHLAFFIGRIVEEKGVHVLLEAWARVLPQARGKLMIAGVGPQLDNCKAHAWHLGLGEQVVFLGQISDEERSRLYRAADVAVFPSLYEPFGIVALEAMAAECPVVVTQTGGLQEIVRPHDTGISVVTNHIDALVWGLLHTLQNPHWSRARATNALRYLYDIYSWANVAREHMAIYRRTCPPEIPHLPDAPLALPAEPKLLHAK
jgi:glycosyltransferase involved in cell wall biosynthesis